MVCCQQIVQELEDGLLTADKEADPLGILLGEFEKKNHDCIEKLEAEGFFIPTEAKLYCEKLVLHTIDTGDIVRTIPNTREH